MSGQPLRTSGGKQQRPVEQDEDTGLPAVGKAKGANAAKKRKAALAKVGDEFEFVEDESGSPALEGSDLEQDVSSVAEAEVG